MLSGNLRAEEVEGAIKQQKTDFPDGIPECGADALRFGLLKYTIQARGVSFRRFVVLSFHFSVRCVPARRCTVRSTVAVLSGMLCVAPAVTTALALCALQGRDINMDVDQVVAHRQFCNKLWQATSFVLMNLQEYVHDVPMEQVIRELAAPSTSLRERWILSRLSATVDAVTAAFKSYAFSAACSGVYDFIQKDFCDYYIVRDDAPLMLSSVSCVALSVAVLVPCGSTHSLSHTHARAFLPPSFLRSLPSSLPSCAPVVLHVVVVRWPLLNCLPGDDEAAASRRRCCREAERASDAAAVHGDGSASAAPDDAVCHGGAVAAAAVPSTPMERHRRRPALHLHCPVAGAGVCHTLVVVLSILLCHRVSTSK